MKRAAWVTTLCGLIAYSCSGTETQNPNNPLMTFKDSGCKKEAVQTSSADASTLAQALVSIDFSAEVAGLKCIAWEATGTDRLKIDLYNFEGACGAEWTGKAAIESDGGLRLSLVNPQCRLARCGWCIYDWSFEVEGIDTSKPVPVTVGIDTCPGEQEIQNLSALLPVDANSSGIRCNHANFNALGWQASALTECGTVAMPCQGTSMCSSTVTVTEPTCQGDLVCTDNGIANQRICAKPCTVDEDCGSLGVLACTDGLCRPKNNW